MASETMTGPAEPGEDLGRYRLLKKIARGGMAEVFAARTYGAFGFEKTVAIKRILPRYGNDPQFVRMMVDEAKITVLLNHPNVAQILELQEQDGDYFIVMEFVPGVSLSALAKRLRDKGDKLGLLESCFVVVELLQGLHAAHGQRDASGKPANIIHRDVSPQNVLLSFDGHTKIIDFGIARAQHRLEMTEVGTIKGKLRYLAPEMIDPLRFMKSGDFDHRVDVFAAGIVLWELLANRTLYQGDDEMAVYELITDSDAPDLHEMEACDRQLADIVKKALTRDPERRYLTAEDFADDLRAYLYRSDPAFTHKRIAAVLEKRFASEKEEMLALERGGVSGPLQRAFGKEDSVSVKPSEKPTVAVEPPAPPTQQMRSDSAKQQPRSKKVVDVGDARAPVDAATVVGDVKNLLADADDDSELSGLMLRGNTIVSKSGRSASAKAKKAADFKANAETLTVADDPNEPASTAVDRPPERTDPPIERVSKPPQQKAIAPKETVVAPTMHTELTQRPRASSVSARRPRPRVGGRTLLLAAATGVGFAIIGIVALELSQPAEPQTVKVMVTSNAPGAVARHPSVTKPVPASFDVLPGDAFELRVTAPGYAEATQRVQIPKKDAQDLSFDIQLDPLTAPLIVKVAPANATILVDEKPYDPSKAFPIGSIVMVQAEAAGHVSMRREVEVKEGEPVVVDIELRPEDEVITQEPPPDERRPDERRPDERRPDERRPDERKPDERAADKKPVDKKPVEKRQVVKTGTLKLVTKPVWAQVTIDGRQFEETTPLSIELKPGSHNVVLTHAPKQWKKEMKVVVKAGELVEKVVVVE